MAEITHNGDATTMKVEYAFDKTKLQALGYTYEQAVATVKRVHAERNLPCIADGEILAFSDNGNRQDYSNLWIIITRLINSSWFLKCATAMRWFDENDDDCYEDVLEQAEKLRR